MTCSSSYHSVTQADNNQHTRYTQSDLVFKRVTVMMKMTCYTQRVAVTHLEASSPCRSKSGLAVSGTGSGGAEDSAVPARSLDLPPPSAAASCGRDNIIRVDELLLRSCTDVPVATVCSSSAGTFRGLAPCAEALEVMPLAVVAVEVVVVVSL